MKISVLDKVTNKMVDFNSWKEANAFNEKQSHIPKGNVFTTNVESGKEVSVVTEAKGKKWVFSMIVEASDEIDAKLAVEMILLTAYEKANDMSAVLDCKELSEG